VFCDSVLSVTLLALFIKPLKDLRDQLGGTPRSVAALRGMERMTKKNRNLLLITVTVTISLYTTIAAVGDLSMRTVIYMCAIDRLVTLQCITMTFSYDKRAYCYCHACYILFLETRMPERVEEENPPPEEVHPRSSTSISVVFLSSQSSTSILAVEEEKSLN